MQTNDKKIPTLNGSGKKAGIVVARFNHHITDQLLASARAALAQCNVNEKDITVVQVAGAVEIPFALHALAQSKKYDFLVALGCVIRGQTPHFDYVCSMAQQGVLKVMIEDNIPVGFGILTLENTEQAQSRLGVGGDAARAALELSLIQP